VSIKQDRARLYLVVTFATVAENTWVILSLLFLQLAGTLLVLIILPEAAFQWGNPLFLTTEGGFVIKNLVLIAAGLAVGGTVRYQFKKRQRQQITGENEQIHSSSTTA